MQLILCDWPNNLRDPMVYEVDGLTFLTYNRVVTVAKDALAIIFFIELLRGAFLNPVFEERLTFDLKILTYDHF